MRTIKFRGKRIDNGELVYGFVFQGIFETFDTYIMPQEIYNGYEHNSHLQFDNFNQVHPESVGQFTGLLDKNGKEIYEGDVLLCKISLGDEKKYQSNAYYKVEQMDFRGVSVTATKMFDESPDNQHPISTSASFLYGKLCTDYRNKKYSSLAFEDSWGSNPRGGSWKENNYSNDIEIAGNIYENPELLKP